MAAANTRADRMETQISDLSKKIDELTKVVTTLARIEERMVALFKHMERQDGRIDSLESALAELKEVTLSRGVIFSLIDKVFWLVAGAAVAYAASAFGK